MEGGPAEDAALVHAVLQGGPEHFAPIVHRYRQAVFGVVLSRVRHFQDAEDLTQATFLEAYQGLERLRDAERLGAWLRSIAIHRSINHVKRRTPVADAAGEEEQAEPSPTPDAELERAELRQQVLRAIGRLGRTQRETMTLFYVSEYSLAEVAAILEVPVGTVKRRLHEARGRLREEMLKTVADVLSENAPEAVLADRVYQALVAYPPGRRFDHAATQRAVVQYGSAGREGFARSYQLPHWRSRLRAVCFVAPYYGNSLGDAGPPAAFALALLLEALRDSHHRVRQAAATRLLFAARHLPGHDWMTDDEWVRQALPLHVVCRAMVREKDPDVLSRFCTLVSSILWAQEEP